MYLNKKNYKFFKEINDPIDLILWRYLLYVERSLSMTQAWCSDHLDQKYLDDNCMTIDVSYLWYDMPMYLCNGNLSEFYKIFLIIISLFNTLFHLWPIADDSYLRGDIILIFVRKFLLISKIWIKMIFNILFLIYTIPLTDFDMSDDIEKLNFVFRFLISVMNRLISMIFSLRFISGYSKSRSREMIFHDQQWNNFQIVLDLFILVML